MKNKGFLLIELLIVALIIAILTSIMLPKYKNAIDKTKSVEMNTAINAAKKNVELYNQRNAQIGIDGAVNMHKLQGQINQGVNPPINRQPNAYRNRNFSDSEQSSMVIKFED